MWSLSAERSSKCRPSENATRPASDGLTQFITLLLQRSAIVWVQNPSSSTTTPSRSLTLRCSSRATDFYGTAHPRPEDVLLIIEVSDTTLDYDRKVKVPLYARRGIPETWVVSLPEERIEVYADPVGGDYQTADSYASGEELHASALAALRLSVREVLG